MAIDDITYDLSLCGSNSAGSGPGVTIASTDRVTFGAVGLTVYDDCVNRTRNREDRGRDGLGNLRINSSLI